jgi:hypothetical protein
MTNNIQLISARKTAKEWAAFNNEKLFKLEQQAKKELEELGDVAPEPKPGLIFAYFKNGFLQEKDSSKFGQKWASQLATEGIKSSVYEAGNDTWVIATHRKQDAYIVLDYLMSQPEVMRTTFESADRWNLPRYQEQYEEHLVKRAEEKKKREEDEKEALRKREERKTKKAEEKKQKEEEAILEIPIADNTNNNEKKTEL